MHFPAAQSNLLASLNPRIASIVNDLPMVGGLGLPPPLLLLLLLEVTACCRSAEYMKSGEGDAGALPMAGPRTGSGYC